MILRKFILSVTLATITYGVFTYFIDSGYQVEFSFLRLVAKSLIFGVMMGIVFIIIQERPWKENIRNK